MFRWPPTQQTLPVMGGPTAMAAESAIIAVGPPIMFTLLSPLAATYTAMPPQAAFQPDGILFTL